MIFFDIDTQHDFMDADGALAVPDADAIKPNLERLLVAAGKHKLLTISSRCAHEPGDAEFEIFPPHCLEGTRGAERIFDALPHLPRHEFEADAQADEHARLNAGHHYVVKKKAYDLFTNAWLEALRTRGAFAHQECVIFGVATDYCVRAAALGLAQAGARVLLVEDAIRGVAPDTTEKSLAEFRAAGVEFTKTETVLNQWSVAGK
ncbi:MAG: isochorismatase family protein [Acidobacteria bacterium]|nr:isochorismatase family protein [Acidobacteriota bacterium]